jgi:hypothetical protein
MITAAQLQFQTPVDIDHQWGETYWLGLYVPEANLYGWVYLVFRAGSGAVTCDVEFIDRKSREMYDARYVDIQNHLLMPTNLRSFNLSNGLTFQSDSPREWRLDYIGVHDTEIHVDLVGIHEPYDIHDPDIDPLARTDGWQAVEHSGFGSAYAGALRPDHPRHRNGESSRYRIPGELLSDAGSQLGSAPRTRHEADELRQWPLSDVRRHGLCRASDLGI